MREMNKHKSCEHREHGGRDQSQMKNKSFKKFEKVKSVPRTYQKSHNDDTYVEITKYLINFIPLDVGE